MVVRILSPSMLSIDFGHMSDELINITAAGVDTIHVDVMDGVFVPNISFGPPVIKYVRRAIPDARLDVHMMVQDPVRYLDAINAYNIWSFTIHAEATEHLEDDLRRIREAGVRAGVAISPDTPVSSIEHVLGLADMVLVMSVYPGFGGQSFIPGSLDKIRRVAELRESGGYSYNIEVDGGVVLDNLDLILEAGADVIVAGSAIFGDNTADNAREFLDRIR